VSFASTIGATLAFLASRPAVQGERAAALRQQAARGQRGHREGRRLLPVRAAPGAGLSLLRHQPRDGPDADPHLDLLLGQPGRHARRHLVYVNAGTQLARIESVGGILSPASSARSRCSRSSRFIAKRVVAWIEARKVYARWQDRKPKRFDYNLLVIGAGSAGLVSAYIAAAVKAKVALVEKHRMGGDCLNTGCVPSKALIRSAKFLAAGPAAERLGMQAVKVDFRFADLMQRVQRVIQTVEPHDSVERYTALGVDCIQGRRTIDLAVDRRGRPPTAQRLSPAIVIAAGARPVRAADPGDRRGRLPDLGQRLGAAHRVAQAPRRARRRPDRLRARAGLRPRRLAGHPGRDGAAPDAARGSRGLEMVRRRFVDEGIDVRLETQAKAFRLVDGEKHLVAEHAAARRSISRSTRCWSRSAAPPTRPAMAPRTSASNSVIDAPSRSTNSCRPTTRTSSPAATWPGPTSSPTPRRTTGLVRVGQRPVRQLPQVQGRLLGDPVGDLHRARGRPRRPQRERRQAAGHRLRADDLRHRRPRPRDRRRGRARAWSRS
jgi:hypothetical protein